MNAEDVSWSTATLWNPSGAREVPGGLRECADAGEAAGHQGCEAEEACTLVVDACSAQREDHKEGRRQEGHLCPMACVQSGHVVQSPDRGGCSLVAGAGVGLGLFLGACVPGGLGLQSPSLGPCS